VALTELNTAIAAEGTQAAIDAAKQGLIDGTIKVFNTANFTVKGQTLTTYMADVDTDAEWKGDTEVIADGYFHESEYRSAPYFDIDIDGITTIQ
ncbi:MAG: BMP family ABC transporter substrate-binding protein, partial [Clostridia bacterium]|nr:BMP family ABC transporter substrate-binding protein [Clostridia bacterium]